LPRPRSVASAADDIEAEHRRGGDIDVGLLLVIERDAFTPHFEKRITADDPYFRAISSSWGEALKKAFVSLPDYSFEG